MFGDIEKRIQDVGTVSPESSLIAMSDRTQNLRELTQSVSTVFRR